MDGNWRFTEVPYILNIHYYPINYKVKYNHTFYLPISNRHIFSYRVHRNKILCLMQPLTEQCSFVTRIASLRKIIDNSIKLTSCPNKIQLVHDKEQACKKERACRQALIATG